MEHERAGDRDIVQATHAGELVAALGAVHDDHTDRALSDRVLELVSERNLAALNEYVVALGFRGDLLRLAELAVDNGVWLAIGLTGLQLVSQLAGLAVGGHRRAAHDGSGVVD